MNDDYESRVARVRGLIEGSFEILAEAIETYVEDREIVATCALYSGGNDSTTMTHLFKDYSDYAVHINTGIGIEQTRDFVRQTCDEWGLPLIERQPPAGSTYRELVLEQGFPGPAMHFKMYQRLKERGLMQVRREFVKVPRKQRIIFLAGRRRDESKRRQNVPDINKQGSIIWVSPMVHWTKQDLNTYRQMFPEVPQNPVSAVLHMSGECLCGAFAKPGELNEISFWYPNVAQEIWDLEKDVQAAGHTTKGTWGWGAYRQKPSKVGPMCGNCDVRYTELEKQ